MPHQPGELLGGRYLLHERIAAGGMGEVWQASDTVLRREVAVKTMQADRAGDPQFQIRFQNEARVMATLRHPGIAQVYDFGQDAGADAYLVMAWVRGQPVDQWIAERGRLTPGETMSIVTQAARALHQAHEAGIVHRDVKPSNLIIEPDGAVVLIDFGVARSPQSAALTGVKEVVGTPFYMAPEQVQKQPTGPPADIYALGAVAYHCLAGHPPFLGDNPVAVAMQQVRDDPPPLPKDIPAPVRAVVTTALAKKPGNRFPTAAAMATAAERATGAAPAVPLRPFTEAAGDPAARGRRRRAAATISLVVLMGLGTGTALAFADPLGWFPATPQPSDSATVRPDGGSPQASPKTTERATPTRTTRRPPTGSTRTVRPSSRQPSPSPSESPSASAPGSSAPPSSRPVGDPPPSVGVPPVSARPLDGPPASGRPASGRPASGRPASGRPVGDGAPAPGRSALGDAPAPGRSAVSDVPAPGRSAVSDAPAVEPRPARGDAPAPGRSTLGDTPAVEPRPAVSDRIEGSG